MKKTYDVIVIGAGPAGLAAAIEAKKAGASVLIIERNNEPGGILLQCIHNGFGSVLFKKDLPGPSYAYNFIEETKQLGIEMLFDTMVLDIGTCRGGTPVPPETGSDTNVTTSGPHGSAVPTNTTDSGRTGVRPLQITATNKSGFLELEAKAIVLAMGCRERTRAQIRIPGDRPAGVFTAGMVQRLVNIEGFMPGKNFVILGSGDIGMIMARRLTIEGAKVLKVLELMPYLTGLRRNYVQCLEDFGIPLSLSTTVTRIIGKKRVEAVETVKVDETLNPIPDTREVIPCDSLLLSIGLIPENELSKKAGVMLDPLTAGPIVDENMATNVPGIFAAGNVVAIYDLVDYVSKAGFIAGKSAADYVDGKTPSADYIEIKPGESVRSVMPQRIHKKTVETLLAASPTSPIERQHPSSQNFDGHGQSGIASAKPEAAALQSETGTSPVSTEILLELRVTKEFPDKCSVDIMAGDTVVKSFRQKYARPAEMITLKIKRDEIAKALPVNIKELSVKVTPAAT